MRPTALKSPPLNRLFAAFESPAYWKVWLGSCLNSTSRWIARLAIGWLMLELTDSALWVGLAAGAEGAGQLCCGVLGGVLVDRLDRRVALLFVYLSNALVFLTLGLLVLTGGIEAWHVLVAAGLLGMFTAIQVPASSTVVYQIVGRARLVNATAAQTFSFNMARIVGSALAGAIIAARGVGPAFLAGAGVALTAALVIATVRGVFRSGAPQSTVWVAAAEGFRYVLSHPSLRRLLALSAIVEGFGFSHYTLVPVMARDVLKVGAVGLGALSTAAGIGALAGTLFMASFSANRNKSALLQITTIAAGLALVMFALSPWYPLSLALSFVSGFTFVAYDVLMQTLIQLLAGDKTRGRVFGLFSLTFGLNLFIGFLAGAAASAIGAPATIATGGGVILVAVLGVLRSVRHIRAEDEPEAVPPAPAPS